MAARLSEETKGAIVQEVHSQLNPLKATVDRLDRTMRSLYSNGSGGPPGYLELAREEDDKRYGALLETQKHHGDILLEMKDFVSTHNQRDREQQARQLKREQLIHRWSPRLWKIGAFLMMSGMSGCVAACHRLEPVVQILWQDYLRAHSLAADDLKKISVNQPDPALESQKAPQDAGNGMPVHY